MRIAIVEISPTGHNTFVESLIRIYSAIPHNEIFLFCNQQNLKMLGEKDLGITQIILKQESDDLASFLNNMNNYRLDKAYIVTMEAISNKTFQISKIFYQTTFNFKILLLIHHTDQWSHQKLSSKILNVINYSKTFKTFRFFTKLYFIYPSINEKVLKKTLINGGRLVVLSEPIKQTLQKDYPKAKIIVVPFSVYEKGLSPLKTSQNEHLRICIPGSISCVRRNYDLIFEILQNNQEFSKQIEWDFLGWLALDEGGDKVKAKAEVFIKNGHKIHLYGPSGIGMHEFDQNLAKADLILCNLYLAQNKTSIYSVTNESGILFSMIKAATPGIFPIEYNLDPALESSVIRFKNSDDIVSSLKNILQNPEKLIQLKRQSLLNSEKYAPLEVFKSLES